MWVRLRNKHSATTWLGSTLLFIWFDYQHASSKGLIKPILIYMCIADTTLPFSGDRRLQRRRFGYTTRGTLCREHEPAVARNIPISF
ncbi:hypothetical protein F4820DRAFT_423901 [Hypoxylon rubiginosum]|uniref:Uncharacterized protein n=1 Tax=Hypoxylon rubiginosum TaxID=110542 RepID=A0ACB9YY62_9PEZI|nr:hypothetical protein F4820DRAFT_423901 [Hypoxylon rubiginosum]